MNRSTEVIGTTHTCEVMHLQDSLQKSSYLLVIIQFFELVALAKTQKKKDPKHPSASKVYVNLTQTSMPQSHLY